MELNRPGLTRASARFFAMALAMVSIVACAPAGQESMTITVIPVGPVQAPPARPVTDLIGDAALLSVVRARVVRVDPLLWHRGEIVYPYCLVHLTVVRGWKQPQPEEFAVRVFGGLEGDRKFVSAIQPDPTTLRPSTEVLLFVSPISEIDPGVRAATVEEFFFIDGDRLLRFDRTPADITVTEAIQVLDRTSRATS